jgi:predicted tellurium resistance membrane protein TerC
MNDRHITLAAAGAILLWLLGGVMTVLGFKYEFLRDAAIYVTCGAGVLSIRVFITSHERSMKANNRNVFELGRDSTNVHRMDRRR